MRWGLVILMIFFAFLVWEFPIIVMLPTSVLRVMTHPEETYLPPETWPKHGEKEDFFVHKYVHVDKTLLGNPSNVTFHYIEAGDPNKETIVFTMGASEPAIVYLEVMKHLVNDYHLISIDGKGFPYSSSHVCNKIETDSQDPSSEWNPYFQGEEMVTALDKIGVKKFNLVSSDLMSIVTSFWVPQWNDRVIRYIRGQSHVALQTYNAVPQGWFFRVFPHVAVTLLSQVRVWAWRMFVGATGFSFLDREKRTHANFVIPEEFNNRVIKILRSGSVVPWVYFWLGLPHPTLWTQIQHFKEVKCPVLLLQGIDDKAQPYYFFDGSIEMEFFSLGSTNGKPNTARWIHHHSEAEKENYRAEKFFSNSSYTEFVWIEKAGHFPHFEAPDVYAEHVLRFLKKTAPLVSSN